MKYYCETIPFTLAEKLKEKGMPIFIEQEWYPNGMPKAEKDCKQPMTKYSEVFDWLIEKDYAISFRPLYDGLLLRWWQSRLYDLLLDKNENMKLSHTWYEAANSAIERALELIKENENGTGKSH